MAASRLADNIYAAQFQDNPHPAVENAFDCGSTGSNRVLYVAVAWDGSGGHTSPTVTYAGNSCASTGALIGTGGEPRLQVFRLVLTSETGSNTLSVDPPQGTAIVNAVIGAWVRSRRFGRI